MRNPKITLEQHDREMTDLRSVVDDLHDQLDAVLRVQAEPNNWLDRMLRRRVTVHTKDGMSFDGSLWEMTDDGLILRAAKLLNENGAPTVMPGEVFIPRANVAFAQLDE